MPKAQKMYEIQIIQIFPALFWHYCERSELGTYRLVVRKQKLDKNVKIEKNKEFLLIFFLNLVSRCTTTMEI